MPRPKIRWDIWLTLNLGLLILLVGIPPINAVFITAGGTLIFIAVTLLIVQLVKMHSADTAAKHLADENSMSWAWPICCWASSSAPDCGRVGASGCK